MGLEQTKRTAIKQFFLFKINLAKQDRYNHLYT